MTEFNQLGIMSAILTLILFAISSFKKLEENMDNALRSLEDRHREDMRLLEASLMENQRIRRRKKQTFILPLQELPPPRQDLHHTSWI